jgi:hypothetical protein
LVAKSPVEGSLTGNSMLAVSSTTPKVFSEEVKD